MCKRDDCKWLGEIYQLCQELEEEKLETTLDFFANQLFSCFGEEKESIDLFHQGLDLYLKREFTKAIALFKKAEKLNPEDKAPEVFIERCNKFIKDPPAADWSGVMTMSTK